MENITKTCNTCKTTKAATEFFKNAKSKDGLTSKCKQCQYEYKKANKDKVAKHSKAYNTKKKAIELNTTEEVLKLKNILTQQFIQFYNDDEAKSRLTKTHRNVILAYIELYGKTKAAEILTYKYNDSFTDFMNYSKEDIIAELKKADEWQKRHITDNQWHISHEVKARVEARKLDIFR